jgi:murein DD-endopeptidase MepM/ murein hydrolase activator NlpD
MESLVHLLEQYRKEFHPVVSFDPLKDKLVRLDFTGSNKELTPEVFNDTQSLSGYVDKKLKNADARYGIGGYGEYRSVYSRSRVFDAENESDESRRLHLGADIWGKPHAAVMAPLDGIVHSFAFNNNFGDYGTTIILAHHLESQSFFTLYGHLSLSSITNLHEGLSIARGDIFAEFGIPAENGHWPPHLHFQVIADIGQWKGDYPGVCKNSEKEKWLEKCPDPDLILQLNQFL